LHSHFREEGRREGKFFFFFEEEEEGGDDEQELSGLLHSFSLQVSQSNQV